jgi:hypothetical protein
MRISKESEDFKCVGSGPPGAAAAAGRITRI